MQIANLRGFRTVRARAFLLLGPTEVATVHGVTFYEDPAMGDARPLWAVVGDEAVLTHAWDAGDLENDSGIFIC